MNRAIIKTKLKATLDNIKNQEHHRTPDKNGKDQRDISSNNSFFVITFLLTSLGILGWPGIFIAAWMLATVCISTIASGYASPPIDFAMYRCVIIFPVYLLLLVFLLKKLSFFKKIKSFYLFIIFVFVAFTGVRYQLLYLQTKTVHINSYFIFDMLSPSAVSNKDIYLVGTVADRLMSLHDQLGYFYPELQLHWQFSTNDYDCNFNRGTVIIATDDKCYPDLSTNSRVLGTSSTNDGLQDISIFTNDY